jgi:hypothetical protein
LRVQPYTGGAGSWGRVRALCAQHVVLFHEDLSLLRQFPLPLRERQLAWIEERRPHRLVVGGTDNQLFLYGSREYSHRLGRPCGRRVYGNSVGGRVGHQSRGRLRPGGGRQYAGGLQLPQNLLEEAEIDPMPLFSVAEDERRVTYHVDGSWDSSADQMYQSGDIRRELEGRSKGRKFQTVIDIGAVLPRSRGVRWQLTAIR